VNKKKQKNFILTGPGARHEQGSVQPEVFWFFFSKKNVLSACRASWTAACVFFRID
jgi:hypothetical protein